jgi:hypothetical protein
MSLARNPRSTTSARAGERSSTSNFSGHAVRRAPVLGGLHHEYWLENSLYEPSMYFRGALRAAKVYSFGILS